MAKAPKRPLTLRDVSEASGVSEMTVSRVLRGLGDVSDGTRARVQEAATRLGYVPNRAGLRLRTGRTQVISLVMSAEHDMMNNTARLISSLAGALRGTSFHLNVSYFFPGEDPMKPIRHIVEMGLADAVIFNQTQPEDRRVACQNIVCVDLGDRQVSHVGSTGIVVDSDDPASWPTAAHAGARAVAPDSLVVVH